jgi:hypothetical protein
MDEHGIQRDSAAWRGFVKVSFLLAAAAVGVGIYFLPADYWAKGYMGMGMLFLTGSSIMLTKTIRDEHEAQKIIHQIQEVKTERLLKEHDSEYLTILSQGPARAHASAPSSTNTRQKASANAQNSIHFRAAQQEQQA